MAPSLKSEIERLKALYNHQQLGMVDLIEVIGVVAEFLRTDGVQYDTLDATVGVLPAGKISGGHSFVHLTSVNAVPGTQTTRSAAEMIADIDCGSKGASYLLRITNTGAGTFTLGAGANVNLVGTMTVPQNTWRDFYVYVSDADVTITSIGVGTYS